MHRLGIRGKILLLFALINLIATAVYTTYNYHLRAAAITAEIDGRLRTAAFATSYFLDNHYLERARKAGDISELEYRLKMQKLYEYAKKVGVHYLYLFTLDQGQVVYLADSASDSEITGKRFGHYFEPYRGPTLEIRNSLKDGVARYSNYVDSYGHFRAIFLPMNDSTGRRYVVGADFDIEFLQQELNVALIDSALIGAVLFVLGVVLSWLLATSLARPVLNLVYQAKQIEQGHYQAHLQIDQHDELGELGKAINTMSQAISNREAKIMQLAFSDALTGLPNRAKFIQRVDRALRQQPLKMHAVLLLDIDRFKYVNDYLGYLIGDFVIRTIAERLAQHLKPADILARLGGDEFAIFLCNIDSDKLTETLTRLEEAVAAPFDLSNQRLDLTASIGVALFDEHGGATESLLRHAEMAMYKAKQQHAGALLFDVAHEQNRASQLLLHSELKTALEENQLVLFYQPKLNLRSQQVTGAEALIRWHHPTRGWVPPNQFIPFAEQTGYVRAITRWVVEHALVQIKMWALQGRAWRVSVNVVIADVEDSAFVDFVASAVTRSEVDPSLLCLEITETGVMQNPLQLLDNLKRLRALGVYLSIDDFGTGYSSLSYLSQMPVHELKIDQSFVTTMAERWEYVTVVRAVIELGHILGLEVVAEGVETSGGLAALTVMGADYAQGFLLSRPLPAEDFEAWCDRFLRTAGSDQTPPVYPQGRPPAKGFMSQPV